jgi:phospholipase/carboxylesterase
MDGSAVAAHAAGQLVVRPHAPRPGATAPTGSIVLAGVPVLVPASYDPARPVGVLVMLHGAGGKPAQSLAMLATLAEHRGFLVIAPKSADVSWDVLHGGYGPDVAQIDGALEAVLDAYAIDPGRIAIGGFSDGASYAISLGLANGELFGAILGFSPGFDRAPRRHGRPRIFIAHGTGDRVLSIAHTSREIVPTLRRDHYPLEYIEFEGGHVVLDAMLERATTWWLDPT